MDNLKQARAGLGQRTRTRQRSRCSPTIIPKAHLLSILSTAQHIEQPNQVRATISVLGNQLGSMTAPYPRKSKSGTSVKKAWAPASSRIEEDRGMIGEVLPGQGIRRFRWDPFSVWPLCHFFRQFGAASVPCCPHGQSAQSVGKVAASEVLLVIAVPFFQQIVRSSNAADNRAAISATLIRSRTSFRTAKQATASRLGW